MKGCCELSYNKKFSSATFCCKISDVNETFSPEEFGKWLTAAFEESRFKSWEEVAKLVGSTRSTLSRYAGAKPQTTTGKASQPKAELAIKIAKVFEKDVDEALLVAGHAPRSLNELPEPLKISDFNGFDKEDLEDIAKFILFKKYQKTRKDQQ